MTDSPERTSPASCDPVESLIRTGPLFHTWPDGTPVNWALAPDVLRFLYGCLVPGMNTLEIGAGHSTVVFAIAGTNHVCITPDLAQADRIRAYCAEHKIRDGVTYIHESSDVALPRGTGIPDELDFVLIDGAHRFPFPIVDWHYTERRLRVGGVVAVDDFPIPSVKILYDFLQGEDEWEPVRVFMRTAFFQRVRPTVTQVDWEDQKINRARTPKPGPRPTPTPEPTPPPSATQAPAGSFPRWLSRLGRRA